MPRPAPALSVRVLHVLIVAWASFSVAAVAAVLFFATFDPLVLAEAATFPFGLSRSAGYTLGFFALWLLTASASVISLFLADALSRATGGNG